ncbi:MAG: ROK family protein, partial [Fimbriimonadaceae bacterium]
MSERLVVGVDLGGTNVRAAVFHEDGTQLSKSFSEPSHATDGTSAVVDAITHVISEAIASVEANPSAVGIAVPGHINDALGLVYWSPNFGIFDDGVFFAWKDIDLTQHLRVSTG